MSSKTQNAENVDWNKILSEMKNGNINYIKNLITSNEIDINAQNPENGQSLLIYAIIVGNYDLVKVIINFGANVNIKDNDEQDAIQHALMYGRYKITELVYYQQLSGSLGKDLKHVSTQIYNKDEESKYFVEQIESKNNQNRYQSAIMKNIMQFIIKAIEERKCFSPDLLYYCWYYIINQTDKDPLQSPLWQQMMKTYQEILENTSDKQGWSWIKSNFITSLIWYLPHPNSDEKQEDEKQEDDGDDIETTLKTTLFYELLVRVRAESINQSNKLLKQQITEIKTKQTSDWNELISYSVVNTKYSSNARQDDCGCLKPRYCKHDLSETKYPSSTHFNFRKHYDTQMFFNELLFNANVIDKTFQIDMKQIVKDIGNEMKQNISYRAGPLKTWKRSQTKIENDYINEDYPTAAKILDINRCAIQFKTISQMMKFIQLFTNKINQQKAFSIVDIIRCKNGWSFYKESYPQYTDIKLNVLVKTQIDGKHISIIAEIQLLLDLMSAFKKKAHKLYAVERRFEFVYNFVKLKAKMSSFKNNLYSYQIYAELVRKDALDEFLNLVDFENIKRDDLFDMKPVEVTDSSLYQTLLGDIIFSNGEILKYFESRDDKSYYAAILKRIKKMHIAHIDQTVTYTFFAPTEFKEDAKKIEFIRSLFESINDDKVTRTLLYESNPTTFADILYFVAKSDRFKEFEIIINDKGLDILIPQYTTEIIDKYHKNSNILVVNDSPYNPLLNIIKTNGKILKYLTTKKQNEYHQLLSDYATKNGFGWWLKDKIFWKLLLDSIPNELKVELLTTPFEHPFQNRWSNNAIMKTCGLLRYFEPDNNGYEVGKLRHQDYIIDLLQFIFNELSVLPTEQKIQLLLNASSLCQYGTIFSYAKGMTMRYVESGTAPRNVRYDEEKGKVMKTCFIDILMNFIGNEKHILYEIFINPKNYKKDSVTPAICLIGDLSFIKRMFEQFGSNELIAQIFKTKQFTQASKKQYNYCAKMKVYTTNAILFYEDDGGKIVNANMKKKKIKWNKFLFAAYELRDEKPNTFKQILSYLKDEKEIYKLISYKDDGMNILMRMCQNNDLEMIQLIFSKLKSISIENRFKLLTINGKVKTGYTTTTTSTVDILISMYNNRIQGMRMRYMQRNVSDEKAEEKNDSTSDVDIDDDKNEVKVFKLMLAFINNDNKYMKTLFHNHIVSYENTLKYMVNMYNYNDNKEMDVAILRNLLAAINDKELIKKMMLSPNDGKKQKNYVNINNESLKQLLVEYGIIT